MKFYSYWIYSHFEIHLYFLVNSLFGICWFLSRNKSSSHYVINPRLNLILSRILRPFNFGFLVNIIKSRDGVESFPRQMLTQSTQQSLEDKVAPNYLSIQ
jgi:hypothetical protein